MDSPHSRAEVKLAELVNRIGRTIHCLQFAHGLNPAQWEALRYLNRANRYSRTPTALASYLGTTKGTASQTVKALEAKGCLRRRPEPSDRRVCKLEVTEAGSALLAKDPICEIETAVAAAGLDAGPALAGLDRILQDLRASCGMQSFGVCVQCGHFGDGGPSDGICGLTGEGQSEADSTRICVNFQAAE